MINNLTCVDLKKMGIIRFDQLIRLFRTCLFVDESGNETHCRHSSLFHCPGTSKCISKHRLLDGIDDCYGGADEKYEGSCNLNQTHRFRCSSENKCISPILMRDGTKHCKDGEDEILFSKKTFSYQNLCNGYINLSPEFDDEQNETDETNCEQWPCNNQYTRCDGAWTCKNGTDELNCNQSSKCYPNRHECVSPTTLKVVCLPVYHAGDGKIDCLGATDEREHCRHMESNAYNKIDLTYHSSWMLPIKFLFLPVNRIATHLSIPAHRVGIVKNCQFYCGDHGHCTTYVNNGKTYCQCDSGWSGVNCTVREDKCDCSLDSLCLGTVNNRSICLCPFNKVGPRCLLNSVCQRDTCKNNGYCVVEDDQTSMNNFTCICSTGYSGRTCEKSNCQERTQCENGGQCIQDLSICPSITMCICPECYYGGKCQFTTKGFSLSLDVILAYQIRPHMYISRQRAVIKKSKQTAQWVIITIILLATISLIYDPIHRKLIDDKEEQRTWCIVRYSSLIRIFDSTVHIFHFIIPFLINLLSAMMIIINIARTHSNARKQQTYTQYLKKQFHHQKHLIIGPIINVILSIPRLIISFLSGYAYDNAWRSYFIYDADPNIPSRTLDLTGNSIKDNEYANRDGTRTYLDPNDPVDYNKDERVWV
ncbi:unnamed protein product [Rotaria sordida]|uniref:EGF-like domain-containing protein n=1 Tax=Rotaria sordida TaxID=392033 RepID=A0A819DHM5_9BILA|nr:unnamed protein product [Rotaria sordida]CAF3834679.1 unnamed protein product [Rotaria sordida]